MSDSEEQLFVRVPSSLKYLVDEDDRTNKEIVISALETELGVRSEDSVAVIDRRIARLEDRLEDEKAGLDEQRSRLSRLQNELERAREVRSQKVESEGSYEDRLDSVLDAMVAGDLGVVFPTHGRLDSIREEFDRSNEEIHLDLQQQAAAQNRDLTVADFKQAMHTAPADDRTPISEEWPNAGGDE